MSVYVIEEYKTPALRMQQKLFYISCVANDECNLWVITSSGVWHRRSKSIMEWIESEIIRYTTAIMKMIVMALFYFVSSMRRLHHDVMILWRDTTTLIKKTKNNKPSTHQNNNPYVRYDRQAMQVYIFGKLMEHICVSPGSIASTTQYEL